nr:hypothetical protein [Bacillus sp. T3]
MVTNQLNIVNAGTCGRLFDAVSAMTGICQHSTYDGEAAIKLGELARMNDKVVPYPCSFIKVENRLQIDFTKMLEEIADEILSGKSVESISTRFHETIVRALVQVMVNLHEEYPENSKRVVLSGGSLHNRYLRERLSKALNTHGFQVFNHHKVPCNDGGLSYGQLLVAAAIKEASLCV